MHVTRIEATVKVDEGLVELVSSLLWDLVCCLWFLVFHLNNRQNK